MPVPPLQGEGGHVILAVVFWEPRVGLMGGDRLQQVSHSVVALGKQGSADIRQSCGGFIKNVQGS